MKKVSQMALFLILVILLVSCGGGGGDASTPTTTVEYKVSGLNFGPGRVQGVAITEDEIRARIKIIAPYTKAIRTFYSSFGHEKTCKIAHEFGLKCYQGAWVSSDSASTETEIINVIDAGKNGYADAIIIGSEALLRGDQTASALINHINRVKAALPNVPVTTGDTYNNLLNNPTVMDACDFIFPNYYPLWEGYSINIAVSELNKMHQKMVAAAGGKKIIISETGWSSCGTGPNLAVPSLANAAFYFKNFVSWAKANDVDYFYFEAFDESWKTSSVGQIEGCWGIWNETGILKSGIADVFNGQTMTDNWSCNSLIGGSGTPTITFTTVPSLGTINNSYLIGTVSHVIPVENKIVLYIKVGSTWWIKPTYAQPLTDIKCDGTWQVNTVTGGQDETATEFAVYVVPATFAPPATYNASLLQSNSLVWETVTR